MRRISQSLVVATMLLASSARARAGSIPNETAWAVGTGWQYREPFLGFPAAWIYVPSATSPRTPGQRGLVLHLLGCGQVPHQIAQAAGWPDAAEAYGLVVVVPAVVRPAHPNREAPNVECFNYGYDGAYGVYNPTRNDADHAAIIDAAGRIPRELPDWAVDPRQVYVAGLSAGGALAVQVACMAPERFAGSATAAAPGMGSSQGTAVMPPPFGYGKETIKRLCLGYASGSGAPDAPAQLASQVHAIVSDDNALRPGNGPLDTTWFKDQQYWDGDKFCPHAYKVHAAAAFADLLGLGEPAERGVVVASGPGIGCAGGEASQGDAGEVRCRIAGAVNRGWQAKADLWRDAEGRTRLVRIVQDTLRHAWPSGPASRHDREATPTRDQLRAQGILDASTGEFVLARANAAPNGSLGVLYLNQQAMDYPMFVAELFTRNNPRLGPAWMAEGGAGEAGGAGSGGGTSGGAGASGAGLPDAGGDAGPPGPDGRAGGSAGGRAGGPGASAGAAGTGPLASGGAAGAAAMAGADGDAGGAGGSGRRLLGCNQGRSGGDAVLAPVLLGLLVALVLRWLSGARAGASCDGR